MSQIVSVAAESAAAPAAGRRSAVRSGTSAADRLHAVIEAQRAIACAPPDVAVIFQALADAACSVLGAEAAVTSQPENDHLVSRATAGTTRTPVGDVIPVEGTLGGRVLRTGRPQLCRDGRTDRRTTKQINQRNSTLSSAMVPLIHDGAVIAVVAALSSVPEAFDENDLELLSMLADIGASRLAHALAEQAQAELETRSTALVEVLTEGVLFHAPDGTIVYANPAAERIVGVPTRSMLGGTEPELGVRLLREDGSAWDAQSLPHARVLATGLPQRQQLLAIEGAHGRLTWLLVRSVPFHDHGGRLTGALTSFVDVTERREAEQSLREASRRLTSAQELTGLASWTLDPDTGRHEWSDEMFRLMGLEPRDEAPDLEEFLSLVHPDDREGCRGRAHGDLLASDGRQELFRVVHPDGTIRHLQAWTTLDKDDQGRTVRVSGATMDVTQREASARELAASEQHFRVAFDNAPIGMSMLSLAPGEQGRYLRANAEFCAMLGYEHSELVQMSMADLTHPDDVVADRQRFNSIVTGEATTVAFDKRFRRKDGTTVFAWLTSSVAHGPTGEPLYLITHAMDVTQRRQQQAELERLALTDTLTGLANRTLLNDRLDQALARLQRMNDACAVLLLDIDRFKLVNDSLGHQVGDALLVEVAHRVSAVSRADSTVARLGGDEFVVLVEGLSDTDDVHPIAVRLLQAMRRPYQLAEAPDDLVASVSIGISVATSADRSPSDLYREADLALYRAKDSGRDQYALFDNALRCRVEARMESESLLRRALADDLVTPLFQPIVDLRNGRIHAVESLARIADPERGLVGPLDFVDVAEETGLVVELDARMFELAMRHFAQWSELPQLALRRVSTNVSARSLEDPTFVERLGRAMACYGVEGSAVRVEITESSLLSPGPVVLDSLRRIADLGIDLGLDDFGTGYSALAYLQRFDLRFLKIDRSFVSGLGNSTRDDSVVASVIELAHAHELIVVAEGVETQAQMDALRAMGCDRAQGFLIGRPMSADELVALVRSGPRW